MTRESRPLAGRRILVVEDEYLIGKSIVDLLEDAGADVVGLVGWVDDALEFVNNRYDTIDIAILDVNLHGEKSYPIADALAARDIRFIFVTGYKAAALEGDYKRYPHCEKPLNEMALVATLRE